MAAVLYLNHIQGAVNFRHHANAMRADYDQLLSLEQVAAEAVRSINYNFNNDELRDPDYGRNGELYIFTHGGVVPNTGRSKIQVMEGRYVSGSEFLNSYLNRFANIDQIRHIYVFACHSAEGFSRTVNGQTIAYQDNQNHSFINQLSQALIEGNAQKRVHGFLGTYLYSSTGMNNKWTVGRPYQPRNDCQFCQLGYSGHKINSLSPRYFKFRRITFRRVFLGVNRAHVFKGVREHLNDNGTFQHSIGELVRSVQ